MENIKDIEDQKINQIAKSMLENFDNANLSKQHQERIVERMKEILN